jgi:hypothetical protein
MTGRERLRGVLEATLVQASVAAPVTFHPQTQEVKVAIGQLIGLGVGYLLGRTITQEDEGELNARFQEEAGGKIAALEEELDKIKEETDLIVENRNEMKQMLHRLFHEKEQLHKMETCPCGCGSS